MSMPHLPASGARLAKLTAGTALALCLAAGVAFAQTSPAPTASAAPPSPSAATPDLAVPPPPPGPDAGPGRGIRPPPPPPRGAAVVVDHLATGGYHVDVRCAEQDTTRECAAIATQLLDKLNGAVQAK